MTERGKQGNNWRCLRWRSKHNMKWRKYMREYMQKKRADTARVLTG